MKDIEKTIIPFAAGMILGHYGLKWFIHAAYLMAIVVAYIIGKHCHI
jgi:hypothetical protein